MSGLQGQLVDQDSSRQDGDGSVGAQLEQMAIARHDCFGLGDQGTGKYSIVVRVGQNYRWNSDWLDRGCKCGIAEH